MKCNYCQNKANVLFEKQAYCDKHYKILPIEKQIEYCIIEAEKGSYSAITELFYHFTASILKECFEKGFIKSYKLKEIDMQNHKIFGLVFQAQRINCKSNEYIFVLPYDNNKSIGVYNMLQNISNLFYKEIERKQVKYEYKDRVVIPV